MSLSETILNGLNNPECAFYVGQTIGYSSAGQLMLKIGLIYFGFKFLDKFVFEKIPIWYKKINAQKEQETKE